MDEKEWRDLVWSEIKELRKEIQEVRSENRAILETMTTLKVKLGVIVGIASTFVSLGVTFLKEKIG
jgi:uncharacterized coiled-coil DUF342 family protein